MIVCYARLRRVTRRSRYDEAGQWIGTGTLPIDKAKNPFGLDHDAVETIKEGAGASSPTWTGIAPNGDIWAGTNDGKGRKEGNTGDYGYGNKM